MKQDAPQHIVLYSKPGCHLCEIAHDLARGLMNEQQLVIEKIDITTDPQLFEKYHDKIPVLVINQSTTLYAPIRTADLRQALKR